MKIKKNSRLFVLIFFALLLLACGGDSEEIINMTNTTEAWSKDIPQQFIEFDYGQLLSTAKDDNTWALQYIDVSDQGIEKYKKKLKGSGWKEDPDATGMEPRSYTKGNNELLMVIGVAEDDGTHYVTLYLDDDAGFDDD